MPGSGRRMYRTKKRTAAAKKLQSFARKYKKTATTKQVKKNEKDIKALKAVGFQYCPFMLKKAETVSQPIHVHLLTAPNNWTGIFRMHGVINDDIPRQYSLKSVNVNWAAQVEKNNVGNLWLQVMVVSLKSKMAAQILDRTTRLSTMTENLDYIRMSAGTKFAMQGSLGYKLNPQFYTTHYDSGQRRIGEATMGTFDGTDWTNGTPVTNIHNSTTQGSCTVKFKRTFKNDKTDDDGFKGLNYEQLEPRQHLYLIYFSNTSGSVITGGELFTTHLVQFNGHCNNPN